MNLFVEKYDMVLKQRFVHLGKVKKLVRVKDITIISIKAELKEASEQWDRAIPREKILEEELAALETELKSTRSAAEEWKREKARLEREKTKMEQKRDYVASKQLKETKRLKDS